MPRLPAIAIRVFTGFAASLLAVSGRAIDTFQVYPAAILLDRPEAAEQICVLQSDDSGREFGVTGAAKFLVEPSGIASVDERGLVRPLANGTGHVIVSQEGAEQQIAITVTRLHDPEPISFRNEVMPILTKAGCNSGGCHGKAEGQNGFKLSIFGFDTRADHESLVMESRGRRVLTAAPEASLLLQKATAQTPHGGGRKIEPGSHRDRLLQRWIAEGCRYATDTDADSSITGIEVTPSEQILYGGETRQIQVHTLDARRQRRCVTHEAEYDSNISSIAEVDTRGLIQAGNIPGEATILVRYLGHVATCRVTLPRPGVVTFPRPPEHSFIDALAWDKLQQLGIEPSDLSSDAEFLRRVFLDTIGTLPTSQEVREFLDNPAADKRARLVDRLLDREEYVDYWTMKWLDILRADQLKISPQGAVAMQRWLRRMFSENRPFDKLAVDLLTVQGNTSAEGPGSFYKILDKPDVAARSISQLLLGVRIECAQCHHHPSERWSQADYTGLAGFFTGLSLKTLPNGEQALVAAGGQDLPDPRTAEPVPTHALGSPPADFTRVTDRRRILAAWLTDSDNPYFARAIANRMWAHYFGRGLVEPVDDLRDTNPATNEALLQALASHMRDVGYDLKAFTKALVNSRLYQLSSEAIPANDEDHQNFSHAIPKSLPAEVLLDAICQSTGVAEEFNGWPAGYRAIQVWDNRMPSYFFTIFGRPVRASVCECERSSEPSIAQALHLLNAREIHEKITHRNGRAQLAVSGRTPEEIIEELYLSTLSRFPNPEERSLMLPAFAELDRRAGTEDVLWSLLNSKEFVFNH